ncbi:MAG: hypothetical protein F9K24_07285 [Leptonema illini]|jgi:multidrug transporter EmrE-like cation transporter|uniref:EamA domain-containing protein n=1 Tax=Leptonema illini TaxID=183 RepID=A0A833H2Y2_9LEPT|nr:MAG: hypothetical protein F9K24_07285 [Leptonema illini]
MTSYFYVFLTIALTVYGQLVVKWRMSTKGLLPDQFPEKILFLVGMLLDPWILSVFAAAAIAAFSWMAAMTKLPIGQAYPFVSITFPAVVLLGAFFFNEPISIIRILALLLIVLGVALNSQG